MKKIGFIDYYLDEWHANNLPEHIKNSPANKSGYQAAYAWGEKKSPNGMSSQEWCNKNNAALCASIEEVCEKSDAIVILSPDNSEKHLGYAKKAIPFKKKIFIDKTFTPTLKEAQEIFSLAAKHKTPLCSCSSLRFASEIKDYHSKPKSIVVLGSGVSHDLYAVHLFEMIIKVMGTGAEKIMAVNDGLNNTLVVVYKDGRKAVYNLLINSNAPFAVGIESKSAKSVEYRQIESDFFGNFAGTLIEFFDTGKVLADKKETLSIIALIEAGKKALAQCGRWVKVSAI